MIVRVMEQRDVTDRSVSWSCKTVAELGSSRPHPLTARTVARANQARILQGWAQREYTPRRFS